MTAPPRQDGMRGTHSALASAALSALEWSGGWWLPAHRTASPNYNQRPAHALIDLMVLHSISLPPGEYGGNDIHALFGNRLDCHAHPYYRQLCGLEVSCHFFINRQGDMWQYVDCGQRAWHAGPSHYRGRTACNDDSIGIELEGLEGQRFAPEQYTALLRLCRALVQRYPIAYIAGHEHIAPVRKRDPGPGFDWQRLRAALAGSGIAFPPGAT